MGAPGAPVWGAHCPDPAGCNGDTFVPSVYNGTIVENHKFDFIRDDNTTTWYIAWAPNTNMTGLDDDSNITWGNDTANDYNSFYNYINESFDVPTTFGADDDTKIVVSAYRNTSSGPDNKMTFAFCQRDPEPEDWGIDVQSENESITVKVCAEGFEKPFRPPLEGAEIMLKMIEWGMEEPVVTSLTMYDPINNSQVNSVKIGPSGCTVFNVTHPTGWPEWCNTIEGNATYQGDTEDLFVTEVCRFENGGGK
jgi:hypothetical protein